MTTNGGVRMPTTWVPTLATWGMAINGGRQVHRIFTAGGYEQARVTRHASIRRNQVSLGKMEDGT